MGDDKKQLTAQQISALASFIAEDNGLHLTHELFCDVLLLMVENIAFDSSLTEQDEALLIKLCFDVYQQLGATNGQ